jgi:transposase
MADPRQAKRSLLRQQGILNPRAEGVRHENFRNHDFFDPEDLLQVKYEMLRQVDVEKQPVSQAVKAFGFSRPSFYQAQAAFQEAGLAGLLPQKRGPRSGHKLTGELMQFVMQLRAAEPDVSTSQLARRVAQRFGVSVHPRSIDRQLQRQKKLR